MLIRPLRSSFAAVVLLLLPGAAAAAAAALEVQPAESFIVAIARRAGVMSFLAHDHAILATRWTSLACTAPARIDLKIETGSLVIDSPEALAKAQVESKISSSDRNSLQEKILSPRFFDAGKYPAIEFRSSSIERQGSSRYQVSGNLTIRDTTRPVSFPVELKTNHYTGSLEIKQSDFGIEPESIAGVVKVQDPVEIRFDLLANASGKACAARDSG